MGRTKAWLLSLFVALPVFAQSAGGARDCARCHLDWVSDFSDPDAVLLVDKPPANVVSAADTCLGCHDGAVGDSRLSVWRMHGHAVGVTVPDDLIVPTTFPLTDGKLDCRTCHTAHTSSGEQTPATIVFLRAPTPSALCAKCHTDQAAQQPQNHPLAAAPGADATAQPDLPNCYRCHAAHGASKQSLLKPVESSEQLCLPCHTDHSASQSVHPMHVALTDPQSKRTRDSWRPDSDGDSLLSCLTCHRIHNAKDGRFQLPRDLASGAFCTACHEAKSAVIDTAHDLARRELTDDGDESDNNGPCAACHAVHHRPFEARPTEDDPSGSCRTCHAPGRMAASVGAMSLAHPHGPGVETSNGTSLGCINCHDPHRHDHVHFLRDEPDALCATCHADQTEHFAGGHNFLGQPSLTNALGRHAADIGACSFCHDVHYGKKVRLWAATENLPSSPDAWCTNCHGDGGLAQAHKPDPVLHPAAHPVAADMTHPLPLFDTTGQRSADGVVSCATCHNPHLDTRRWPHLLRRELDASPLQLCSTCHADIVHALPESTHAAEVFSQSASFGPAAAQRNTCAPCHAVHGPDVGTGMWTAHLAEDEPLPDSAKCRACHRSGGSARDVYMPPHPTITVGQLDAVAEQPLPPVKQVDDTSLLHISCTTCHLPHGRALPADDLNETTAIRIAAKPMIRPFDTPNLCTACHGSEGRLRFLNFHRGSTQ